jgi:hypothetical protein
VTQPRCLRSTLKQIIILPNKKEVTESIIVDANTGNKLEEINLDLKSAGVVFDDLSDSFIASTGIDGERISYS